MGNKKINVLSLFDGISCGQVALERAGVKIDKYFASEIDKYAIQVTQKNYPNTIQLGDVTKIDFSQLNDIDLLIGGSPCQGFSFAGKQLNFDDPRSKLFFEFVRALKGIKPKYFLLENVVMKQEYQDVISKYLGVEPILINSILVSAQNRKRLYWTNIPNIKHPYDKNILLCDVLENYRKEIKLVPYNIEKLEKLKIKYGYIPEMFNTYNCSEITEKAPCLTAVGNRQTTSSSVILYKDNKFSKLSPIEWERLQTLPDNYTNGVPDTHRYNALGNGWTVDVIAHIFSYLEF